MAVISTANRGRQWPANSSNAASITEKTICSSGASNASAAAAGAADVPQMVLTH